MSDGLSKNEVKELLAAQAEQFKELIVELRKPSVVEQKKLDAEAKEMEDRQQERKENGAAILQSIENKRQLQRICSHKHRDGHSHCVFVQTGADQYILCQKNQCKIRAGVAPAGYSGGDIYDTALFNQLFQELPSNELFN